jgi:GGDEF domain-containing protein
VTEETPPRRTRAKFTLPDRDKDETPTAAFEALVYGPPVPKGTRRTRKFSLPEHHHEEKTGDKISAFLEGPSARRRRSHGRRAIRRRTIEFETMAAFEAGLRREAARQARYGRPTAVLVIAVRTDPRTLGAADAADRRLTDIIGREARETDRASRAGVGRVRLLLLETGEEEAGHLAARIERAFRTPADGAVSLGDIHVEIAIPHRGADPLDAVADADRRVVDVLGIEPHASTA